MPGLLHGDLLWKNHTEQMCQLDTHCCVFKRGSFKNDILTLMFYFDSIFKKCLFFILPHRERMVHCRRKGYTTVVNVLYDFNIGLCLFLGFNLSGYDTRFIS